MPDLAGDKGLGIPNPCPQRTVFKEEEVMVTLVLELFSFRFTFPI